MSRYIFIILPLILLHVFYQSSGAQVFRKPIHQMFTQDISNLQAEKKNNSDSSFLQKRNASGYDWKFTAEEFTISSLTGILASLPAAMVGVWIRQPDDAFEALAIGAYSMYAGYLLGNAYGVYMVNKKHNRHPSFLASLGGSVIFGGTSVLFFLAKPTSKITAVATIVLPPIGAIIGNRLWLSTITATRQVSLQYSGIIAERKVYPALRLQYQF